MTYHFGKMPKIKKKTLGLASRHLFQERANRSIYHHYRPPDHYFNGLILLHIFLRSTILVALLALLFSCSDQHEQPVKSSPKVVTEPNIPKEVAPPVSLAQFQEAALQGHVDMVKQALEQGVDVNGVNPDKRTALMLAGFNGHGNVIGVLLAAGAKVNERDVAGRTALMYASSGLFPKAVKLLIEAGADVNAVDSEEKWTALMFAAGEGHVSVVQLLLSNGADTSLIDIDGDTALNFAITKKHTKTVELLRETSK